MKIEHIALWVNDLELMKEFYCNYFNGVANQKYVNPIKGFSSYFIQFDDGARLELMHSTTMKLLPVKTAPTCGFIHLACSIGSKRQVDELTSRLRVAGMTILGEPRVTGDGYYESVVLDPEGNQLEITV